MHKTYVLICCLLFLSVCLFADNHIGEWVYGEIVDELTGEISSQQLKLISERDGKTFRLGYFCEGGYMYLHSVDSWIDAQTTRAKVDDREVTTHDWIQPGDDIDTLYNINDSKYLLSGSQLLIEIEYQDRIISLTDSNPTDKTVFTFVTENWEVAVEEYCE